jgi:hypothetical protein
MKIGMKWVAWGGMTEVSHEIRIGDPGRVKTGQQLHGNTEESKENTIK